jgi:hypothetical protein
MPYITKKEAVDAASARVRRQQNYNATARSVINESVRRQAASPAQEYDVFLSHASEDAAIVLGIYEILTGRGLKVYVDWIDDAQLDRSNVTAETADLLRERMRSSKSMLFITTKNSAESKWMPWELGYFDGHRKGLVGILPVMNSEYDSFNGQEYLGLYPRVERLPLARGDGKELFIVEPSGKSYRNLNAFAIGSTTARTF